MMTRTLTTLAAFAILTTMVTGAHAFETNTTVGGHTCQDWTAQYPHSHSRTPQNYPNADLGNHNNCRNPDGEAQRWCYTTNPNVRWDWCETPANSKTITEQGHECQRWDTQAPHGHGFTPDRFTGADLAGHNYCRNPDGSRREWCYTTNPNVRWDYCSPDEVPQSAAFQNNEGRSALYLDMEGATVSADGRSVKGDIQLRLPGGDSFPLPEADLSLSLDSQGTITGISGSVRLSLPDIDGMEVDAPYATVAYRLGSELDGLLGDDLPEIPVLDNRHYFVFTVSTGLEASVGPLSMAPVDGHGATFIFEPREPLFFIAGDMLGLGAIGSVEDVALGFSGEGRWPFEPNRTWGVEDVASGFEGQLYTEGTIALPMLGENASMDTEMVIDVNGEGVRFGANGNVNVGIEFVPGVELGLEVGGATVGGTINGNDQSVYFSGDVNTEGIDFLPEFLTLPQTSIKVAGNVDTDLGECFVKMQTNLFVAGSPITESTIVLNNEGILVRGVAYIYFNAGFATVSTYVGVEVFIGDNATMKVIGLNSGNPLYEGAVVSLDYIAYQFANQLAYSVDNTVSDIALASEEAGDWLEGAANDTGDWFAQAGDDIGSGSEPVVECVTETVTDAGECGVWGFYEIYSCFASGFTNCFEGGAKTCEIEVCE